MIKVSTIMMSGMILSVLGWGLKCRVDVFEEFMKGVEDSLRIMKKIFPPLLGLFIAVGLLRASGGTELFSAICKPLTGPLGIPDQVIPLAILRPISGSASLAYVADIFKVYGVDSVLGKIVSVMMGTTETIFYVFAIYFGAVGVKNVRYALYCAIFAEIVGICLSCYLVLRA